MISFFSNTKFSKLSYLDQTQDQGNVEIPLKKILSEPMYVKIYTPVDWKQAIF